MAEELVTSLGALLKLDERVAQQFGEHVICGVRVVLERTSTVLRSAASWETLLSLIAGSADAARAAPIGFATLVRIVDSESLVTSDSFAFVERAAFAFARSGAVESAMSIKALECLYRLHCRVRHVLALRDRVANPASLALRNEAWRSYWLPLLRHLCAVCTDSRTDVRNAAMMILQRTLLGEDLLALGPEGWYACFAEVLFPLSDVLLQSSSPPPPAAKDADASAATAADGGQSSAPQLSTEKVASSSFLFSPVLAAVTGIQPGERPMQQWRASSTGSAGEGARGDPLEETRLRASALLCKIFLHYASTIRPSPEFNALWTSVLRYIERYMQADNSELLAEAVPESLKNILLVMSDSGVLRESSSATDDFGLWKLTWPTISRFCPRLTPSQLGIGSDAVVAPIVAVAVSGAAIANDALTKPNLPQQPVDQQQQQQQQQQQHTEQTPVQQEQQQEQQQQQQPAVAAAAAVAVPVQLAAPLVQVQTSLVQQAGAARPGAPAHFASRVVTQLNTSV
jgi:hypothetical protein